MTLREKIALAVKDSGGGQLSRRTNDALLAVLEKECAERVKAAMMTRSVGKLLGDFSAFIDGKGFEIVEPESVRQEASVSYRLARQIFKNRNVLVPFMCRVAKSVGRCAKVKYSAGTPEEANVLRNFLDGLRRSGHTFDYSNVEQDFEMAIPDEELKRRFFRSDWAEECFRYVISKVVNSASKKFGVRNKIIPNVKIRRKESESTFTEFDVIAQLGDRFYAFEVKSGPWVRIMQWAAREEAFVTEEGPFRVIVCTIHDNIPCEIFEPQVLVNLENFELRVTQLLERDFGNGEP